MQVLLQFMVYRVPMVLLLLLQKRGKGDQRFSYDAYIGTQQPLDNGFNVANTQEYANAIWAQAIGSGVAPTHSQFGSGSTPVIPEYITPAGAKAGDPGTDPADYVLIRARMTITELQRRATLERTGSMKYLNLR